MAKSLRSKHKRKMKAIKRKRYAVKELTQLKSVLTKKAEVQTIAKMIKIRNMNRNEKNLLRNVADKESQSENTESMDVDTPSKKYNKFLRDEQGNFPVWLNPRKIKKLKEMKKQVKKKTKKQSTW